MSVCVRFLARKLEVAHFGVANFDSSTALCADDAQVGGLSKARWSNDTITGRAQLQSDIFRHSQVSSVPAQYFTTEPDAFRCTALVPLVDASVQIVIEGSS